MTQASDPNRSVTAQERLSIVADIIAEGLIRLRQRDARANHRAMDLDNASEERVYVPAFKPPRRDRRDVH